jgi:glutathione synthase/RimK-type ligase-like ATP-grasp enzyme
LILAICNSGQYEISAYASVAKIIDSRGIELISFNQDKCLNNEYLSFESGLGFEKFTVSNGNKKYDVDRFKSIWYMKPMLPAKLIRYKPHEYAHFMQQQFATARKSLWLIFKDRKWLNDPLAMDLAENKIYQLYIARELGFSIPKTLISSNPKEIKAFHKGNKRTILKVLSATIIPDHVVFTSELNDIHLKELDTAKYAPAIYQELIEKKYELRVTVVDGQIFAAKIHSQEDIATSLDWRVEPKLNDFSVKMEPIDLPKKVSQMVLKYVERLGLSFGCIDMIVTNNDEYIFLEINPNGQWYFVQLNTGLDIAKSIARVLCQPFENVVPII